MARRADRRSAVGPAQKKKIWLAAFYIRLSRGERPLWSAASVGNILKNRVYAGDMVQGRHRIKSYKIHVQEAVPEEEWFIVENTHAPIVSREDFLKAQNLLKKDIRTAPGEKNPYLFGGILRCADCGKSMSRSKSGDHVYYYCRTYKDKSKKACTKHRIRHGDLEQGVLLAVRQQIYIGTDVSEIFSRVNAAPGGKAGLSG